MSERKVVVPETDFSYITRQLEENQRIDRQEKLSKLDDEFKILFKKLDGRLTLAELLAKLETAKEAVQAQIKTYGEDARLSNVTFY